MPTKRALLTPPEFRHKNLSLIEDPEGPIQMYPFRPGGPLRFREATPREMWVIRNAACFGPTDAARRVAAAFYDAPNAERVCPWCGQRGMDRAGDNIGLQLECASPDCYFSVDAPALIEEGAS